MSERYEAGVAGEGDWGIWDNQEEVWSTTPLPSLTEEAMTELARLQNENICAGCGEQCGEAHANTRTGRYCEDCADELIDESGELVEPEGFAVPVTVEVVARTAEQAANVVREQIAVRHRGTGDDWDFSVGTPVLLFPATPEERPAEEQPISLRTALTLAISSLDEMAEGAADDAAISLFGGASGTLSRFLESLGYE